MSGQKKDNNFLNFVVAMALAGALIAAGYYFNILGS